MKKKLLLGFFFILFSAIVSAQVLTEQSLGGAPTVVSTTQGGLYGKIYFMLPKKDTLNNAAVRYVGAMTIRPQDTLLSLYPPIYMSNGHFWNKITSNGTGQGIDSITVSLDSLLYQAYNTGNQIFTFSTLLQPVKAGANFYFTRSTTGDTLILNSVTGGAANGLVSVGGLVLADSVLYVQHDVVWKINNLLYTRTTDTFYVIPSADSGYYRKDLIYIDSADGSFNYVQGVQDTVVAFPPVTPNGGIILTIVDVFGPTISQPVPFIVSGYWTTTGNLGTNGAVNYVGTSDSVDFNLSTKGITRIKVKANGDITLPEYITGHTGSAIGNLQVDATGKVIVGSTSGAGWSLTGNAGTDQEANFLGTTDAQGLTFKLNNYFAGRIEYGFLSNVSLGLSAFLNNSSGELSLAFGPEALKVNSTGNRNISLGGYSLWKNTIGNYNIAIGPGSLGYNVDGERSIGIGTNAGAYNNASKTISIGYLAGNNLATQFRSIYIGDSTGSLTGTGFNEVAIGDSVQGHGDNTFTIGNYHNDSTFLGGYEDNRVVEVPDYALGITVGGKIVKFAIGGGADGNGIYSGSGSLSSSTTVDLDGSYFSFSNGANNEFVLDPGRDTSIWQHITSAGQLSYIKLGDDNGTTGSVLLRGADPSNGTAGDLTVQGAGGITMTATSTTDNRYHAFNVLANGTQETIINTNTGSVYSEASVISVTDHPGKQISAQGASDLSVFEVSDTAINISTPIFRINGEIINNADSTDTPANIVTIEPVTNILKRAALPVSQTYTATAPIILTGSAFGADTSKASGSLATYTDVKRDRDSLGNLIATNTSALALKVNISDTTAMLAGYNTQINKNTDSITAHNLRIGSNTTNIALKANIVSPTFTGTVTIPTPFTLGSTSVTTTGAQLNYLNAATGTTGTTSTNLVYSTSPTLTTPNIGAATATSINKVTITQPATSATLTILNGKTLTANNSLTLAGTDATTMTFPTTTATIARTDAAQTFTGNQTFSNTVVANGGLNLLGGTTTIFAGNTNNVTSLTIASSNPNTNSTGSNTYLKINPSWNESSTAAATDLLISRIETGLGSGTQRIISAAVGATEQWGVDNKGKMNIVSGSNKSVGTATLVSGTVTVSNTSVTASSLIFFSYKTPSGTLASGLQQGTIVAATSFVINSLTTAGAVNTADNSTVNWWIIN